MDKDETAFWMSGIGCGECDHRQVEGADHLASAYGPRRFAELGRLLPTVSEKVLTAQLRELESDLIVRREALETQPPQVTYSLTNAGEELLKGLQLLCEWGTKHLGIMPRMPTLPSGVNFAEPR